MRIVHADEAKAFENARTCVAFEYETGGEDVNIARIQISGRYPEAGSAVNRQVTEIVYVLDGTGTVNVDGQEHLLAKGTVLRLEKGERVFWEGLMTILIASTPAWTMAQYFIDD